MVVEFRYIMPNSEAIGVDKTLVDKSLNGSLTLEDVYSTISTRPSNATLGQWWDSNLSFSNALVNYMMGTSSVGYIKSGYMTPKIYILHDGGQRT